MHPLCQAVPLQVLRRAEKAEAADRALDKAAGAAEGAAARERRRVPFVTVVPYITFESVFLSFAHRAHFSHMSHPTFPISHMLILFFEVTDLGSPHPLWLHPSVDLCFVPSEVFERRALYHGLRREQAPPNTPP